MAVGENKSAFDFTDELGVDPMMRRYGGLTSVGMVSSQRAASAAAAKRQLAEAQLATAQTELNAKLTPMKTASEAIASIADLMKQKSALEENAAVQRSAAAISESIPRAKNLDDLIALSSGNELGLRDNIVGPKYVSSIIDSFRATTDNLQSSVDVDSVYAKLPATVAALPEVKGAYDNAKNQATLRQSVREKFAFAGMPVSEIPTTQTGGVDVTEAGMALSSKAGEEARRKDTIEYIKLLQSRTRDLRAKMDEDKSTSATGMPQESDVDEFNTMQSQIGSLMSGLAAGIAAPTPMPTPITPTVQPTTQPESGQDNVGSVLPPGVSQGPSAAAAASTAATKISASKPVTAQEETTQALSELASKPQPEPMSLEEELKAASEAALKEKVLQSVQPKLKQKQAEREGRVAKAERRLKIKNLKDEKIKLEKAISKSGLGEDSDVVKRAKIRISEINKEIGE